jgi:hypothetical protein
MEYSQRPLSSPAIAKSIGKTCSIRSVVAMIFFEARLSTNSSLTRSITHKNQLIIKKYSTILNQKQQQPLYHHHPRSFTNTRLSSSNPFRLLTLSVQDSVPSLLLVRFFHPQQR